LILDRILADKRIEVDARKAQVSLDQAKDAAAKPSAPREFTSSVASRASSVKADAETRRHGDAANGRAKLLLSRQQPVRLIAEIKKASPSRGIIRPDFDPVAIAKTYEKSGASAISVLTDEKYFQGRLEYLEAVHRAVSLPVLQKDFIIDPYQVYEARAAPADAILLIVAALCREELTEFMALAEELGMASLVEVHTSEELDVALEVGAKVIGINNRNLQTFETKLETTLELAPKIPSDRILVSESGIFTRADVERLMGAGVDAILVGESLMRETDPGVKVRELLGNS